MKRYGMEKQIVEVENSDVFHFIESDDYDKLRIRILSPIDKQDIIMNNDTVKYLKDKLIQYCQRKKNFQRNRELRKNNK